MKYIVALMIILIVGFVGFTNNWNVSCLNIPSDFGEKIQWDRGDSESSVSKCDAWIKHKEEYESIKNTILVEDKNIDTLDNNVLEIQAKNFQTILGTDIKIEQKVGDRLGEFVISEIGNCGDPFENNVCGIITKGSAIVEGSFFFNSHFGEYCFKLDVSKEINKNSIVNPIQNKDNNEFGFCFNENMEEKLPQQYLVDDDESFSELVKIKIKDLKFDWRPMGVTNTATFIEIVD